MIDTSSERLFWCDFESTGLLDDHIPPTLLEAAWTISDGAGTQLTPLRKRLLAFTSNGADTVVTPDLGMHQTGEPYGYFDTEDGPAPYPRQIVIDMHEQSGLTTEWATAEDERPYSILRLPAEFDRLLLDDLITARVDTRAPRSLRLAGCGVAQFEAKIMPRVALRAMSSFWPWHYRTADLSVELSNGKIRGSDLLTDVDAIIEHGLKGARVGGETWRDITTETGHADITTFDIAHRADTDVARALAAWRLLALDHR
ncbi:MAG: hypothetical protein H7Y15_08510 [Pseudonocardia sp.]|nr:hypothetical protein [Pseudonocardia sp.]